MIPYERGGRESPEVVDGGARPNVAPMAPELVPFASQYTPGSIVIETHGKQLFLVTSSTEAYRYPISVGRDGFTWNGTENDFSASLSGRTGIRRRKCASATRACR